MRAASVNKCSICDEQPNMFPIQSSSSSSISQSTSDMLVRDGQSLTAADEKNSDQDLRKAFQDFVGQTFFSEMLKAFRATQENSAYFHGGRAEEIFQGQLDQVLTEKLSESSAQKIADPMFELFQRPRP